MSSSKRRRTTRACEACRDRKVGCDGDQPCSRCVKRNQACEYVQRANLNVAYVKELERRLGIAEDKSPQQKPLCYNEDKGEDKVPDAIPEREEHVDAMGADSNILRGATRTYYGASAAVSFTRMLMGSLGPKVTTVSRKKYSLSGYSAVSHKENWVLPPRSVADTYLDRYMRYVYPLYPFIHRPSFMVAYESFWNSGASEDSDLFYSLVNLVFAIGCHHHIEAYYDVDSPSHEQEAVTEVSLKYFERSQKYLTFDTIEHGSLLVVQTLLLRVQYLQATYRAEGCWTTLGVAIRIAQSLGLHMGGDHGSLIEQELRKRVWHGCVMLDRIVSMTFGRPMMVTAPGKVELPLAVDDDLITDTEIGRSDDKSVLRFYIESLRLYGILAEILQHFYQDSMGDKFPSIFLIEQKLEEFERALPGYLRVNPENQTHPFRRQSIILRARFLHVKIILYRPVLLPDPNDHNPTSTLHKETNNSVFKACVGSALELISLLHSHVTSRPFLLPASWYNVFYVYTSAMVLLAAKLQPDVEAFFEQDVLSSAWENSLSLLRNVQNNSPSAQGCLVILTEMQKRITQKMNQESSVDMLDSWAYDINTGMVGAFNYGLDSDFFISTIGEINNSVRYS